MSTKISRTEELLIQVPALEFLTQAGVTDPESWLLRDDDGKYCLGNGARYITIKVTRPAR